MWGTHIIYQPTEKAFLVTYLIKSHQHCFSGWENKQTGKKIIAELKALDIEENMETLSFLRFSFTAEKKCIFAKFSFLFYMYQKTTSRIVFAGKVIYYLILRNVYIYSVL